MNDNWADRRSLVWPPADAEVPDGDVVELTLLVPGWQASALESAAQGLGLTTAQLVRRLIKDYCGRLGRPQWVRARA
jgi:hypothetical protein